MKKTAIAAIFAISIAARPAAASPVSVELDLFELQEGQGDDPFVFDSTITVGEGQVAAVFKVEGGHGAAHFGVEEVITQALVAFTAGGGTTFMAGARHDVRPGGDLTYASLAVEQTLGSLLEGEHYLFISERGDVTGAAELVAGLPLTQSLVLEPRLGLGWSAQDVSEEEVGSGFSDVALWVRLRHAIGPVFNVYVGGVHERLLGQTRDVARTNGGRANVTRALVGAAFAF